MTGSRIFLIVLAHMCLGRVKQDCSCHGGLLHYSRYCGALFLFQSKISESVAANNSSGTASLSYTSSIRYGSRLVTPHLPSGRSCTSKIISDPALGPLSNNSSPAFELIVTNSEKFLLSDESKHELTSWATEDAWTLSVQQGAKLLQGTKADDKAAATLYGLGETVESPYDGDLHDTVVSWGYNDNTAAMQKKHDEECDMGNVNKLKKCFDELGLGTKSKGQGGSNQCFQIEHFDSPAVILNEDGSRPEKANQYYKAPCGTIMRVTDAAHAVGVNGIGGTVIAMNIVSPAKAAAGL